MTATNMTASTTADTLPDMIEIDGECFYKTRFINIAMKNHFWPEGTEMREYWRDGEDDCRLQMRTPSDYYID